MDLLSNDRYQQVTSYLDTLRVVPLVPTSISKQASRLTLSGTPLTDRAFRDLCNCLKLQYTFIGADQSSENWDRTHPKLWRELVQRLSDFRLTVPKTATSPGPRRPLLTAVVSDASDPAKSRIVKVLDRQTNTPGPFDYSDVATRLTAYADSLTSDREFALSLDLNKFELHARFIDPGKTLKLSDKDPWRLGVGLNMGLATPAVSVHSALMRLVCTNGMVVTHSGNFKRLRATNSPEHFVSQVQHAAGRFTMDDVLRHGVTRLRANNASVRECVTARDMIPADNGDFTTLVDLEAIKRAYRDPELFGQPNHWLERANSGVNSYELFNVLTAAATHDPSVTDVQRVKLNAEASRVLVMGPDLSCQPPDPFARKSRR